MKFVIVIGIVLLTSPAMAQSKPPGRADPCAPIGRTANGQLVYSMKCENLPVPVAPARVETAPVAAAPVEEDKGGLFRNPFPSLIRPSTDERLQGVGPPPAPR